MQILLWVVVLTKCVLCGISNGLALPSIKVLQFHNFLCLITSPPLAGRLQRRPDENREFLPARFALSETAAGPGAASPSPCQCEGEPSLWCLPSVEFMV